MVKIESLTTLFFTPGILFFLHFLCLILLWNVVYLKFNHRKKCNYRNTYNNKLSEKYFCNLVTNIYIKKLFIPPSLQNPKVLVRDNAKVIWYLTSEILPFFGNYILQEVQYGVNELLLSWIEEIVRDMGMLNRFDSTE